MLKSSCKGSTLLTLASVKSSSTGVVTKTLSLTATQVKTIKKAATGTARFAIRIGTGTTAKCGVFVVQLVPAYVAASVSVGQSPSGVAIDATGVWVTNWWDNTLSRISPATNTVLSTVPVTAPSGEGLEAITAGGGALWVTTTDFGDLDQALPGSVLRVDPATGALLATIPIGAGTYDIAYGLGGVWVPNYYDGNVQRIDPATNQVVATIAVADAYGITVDATSVWVVSLAGKVTKIDPATNQVVGSIFTQLTGADIAATTGAIWVSHPGTTVVHNGSVSRIDSATSVVTANIPVTGSAYNMAIAGGSVWVGIYDASTVVRINAATNAVMSKVTVSVGVYAIAATTGAVWAVHNLPIPEGGDEPPTGKVTRLGY